MPSVLDSDMPQQPILPTGSAVKPLSNVSPATQGDGLRSLAEPEMRDFTDIDATRSSIYDSVLKAAKEMPEFSNNKYKLKLVDVSYLDSDKPTIAERKKAILRSQTLDRRLQGVWQLRDQADNIVDEKRVTMARIPKLTNGGTFVLNGVEYTLANQARLRPGIFTREKQNGEIESHVNVMPGKGVSHRYMLDPAKGVFKLTLGQASIPLFPVLKALGATESQIRNTWGNELYEQNAKQNDPQAVDKLMQRVLKRGDMTLDSEGRTAKLRELFNKMELDDVVTARTLGRPYKNLSTDAIMDATKKILAVQRREAEPDDRDAMAYQMVYGPEDFFAEKMRSAYKIMNPLLWKATFKNNLSPLNANFLGKHVNAAILSSGLGQPSEEVNNAEILGQLTRMSRLGEGGIPSLDAVPDEARSVQPSHFGFVDPLLTPESLKVGVDSRLASSSRKGKDGKIYTKFLDVKTGQPIWKTPQDVADSVIAFPKELDDPNNTTVAALVSGKIKYVPRDQVEFTLPHMEDSFNPLVNMIPLKSTIKGQRVMMGARMLTQALPLRNAESPYVQSGTPGDADESFEERYGKYMGAIRSNSEGQVVKVTPDEIHVKGPDGSVAVQELHNNLPYNRKTYLHNTPVVQVGDMVNKDSLLAKSNYTDDKGATALGLNLRTAYIPYKGYNFEDATVISESAAKRLSSEHMYQHDVEFDDKTKQGKKAFISMFPSTFDRKTVDMMDDDGVIKPGMTVEHGAPLILQVKEKERAHNQITRGRENLLSDSSVLWEHHDPGVVTDVEKTDKGVVVTVKSYAEMQIGDKLCYDPATEVLTSEGWKPVYEIGFGDLVASLNPDTNEIEYVNPAEVHVYHHKGRMYSLNTTQVNLLVTDNHNLYAKTRNSEKYDLYEAKDLFGKRYKLKKNGTWKGSSPDFVELGSLAVKAGQSGNGERELEPILVPAKTYAMLLGMYLSEGNLFNQPKYGSYGFDICQIKSAHTAVMLKALDEAGVKYNYNETNGKVRIYSKQWLRHLSDFGSYSYNKGIPSFVFDWGTDLLQVLFDWLMWGDGHVGKTHSVYTTTSKKLAGDFQRLCLHLGISANVKTTAESAGTIKGKAYKFRERYDVFVYKKKNHPEINHSGASSQSGQTEEWVDYVGQVFCVTLSKNHIMYVRRKGKTLWCGNSGRYGDKGVIAEIVPDDKMPKDSQGRPFEVLVNPLGVITRTNPGQMIEAALGKITEKTGKRYAVKDFGDIKDMVEFAKDELKKHGMSDTEDIEDPENGQKISKIFTGNRFFMKLHHMAEHKGSGRGIGSYTAEDAPAKGGPMGSKRVSLADNNALLSHGALDVLTDAGAIRGQKNQDYWAAFMAGRTPPQPRIPLVYTKFFEQLKAAGINPIRSGPRIQIMALTNKDVDYLAGEREIKSADTVDWKEGLKPIKGGLFDETLTGGHNGNRWSYIKLHEPMPNPVMEEPIRRVLGLTQKKFQDILAGTETLNELSGPNAIKHALGRINLPEAVKRSEQEWRGGKKSTRDAALKRWTVLKHAQKLGVSPTDWMLDKIPVLPPAFRPVSVMGATGKPLVADPNYLYKEAFDANDALKETSAFSRDLGNERVALYKAFKAVTGLGDPITPKNQERNVKGVLKYIFGDNPKFSVMQRKLLSTTVDVVGRGVITPNPDLDMDEVGLPMTKAWEIYRPFIIRRLAKRGVPPIRAAELVEKKDKMALDALQQEVDERPVIITRAPVLHRYGVMAFKPRLVSNETLQISPAIVKGFGADFDGDTMNYHVPVSDGAVKDALEKMLPSKNLLSTKSFKAHQLPQNEYQGGLYHATAFVSNKPERYFATKADAIKAYRAGEIGSDQKIVILNG